MKRYKCEILLLAWNLWSKRDDEVVGSSLDDVDWDRSFRTADLGRNVACQNDSKLYCRLQNVSKQI